jgi:hypothetical protein
MIGTTMKWHSLRVVLLATTLLVPVAKTLLVPVPHEPEHNSPGWWPSPVAIHQPDHPDPDSPLDTWVESEIGAFRNLIFTAGLGKIEFRGYVPQLIIGMPPVT